MLRQIFFWSIPINFDIISLPFHLAGGGLMRPFCFRLFYQVLDYIAIPKRVCLCRRVLIDSHLCIPWYGLSLCRRRRLLLQVMQASPSSYAGDRFECFSFNFCSCSDPLARISQTGPHWSNTGQYGPSWLTQFTKFIYVTI